MQLKRDPAAPVQRSPAALRKVSRRRLDDGAEVHSFATLIADLASIKRNSCRTPDAKDTAPTF